MKVKWKTETAKLEYEEKRSKFFKPLLNLLGFLMMVYLIVECFTGVIVEGVEYIGGVFVPALFKFVCSKKKSQKTRKGEQESRKKKGEWWVVVWFLLTVIMMIAHMLWPTTFYFPKEIGPWLFAVVLAYIYGEIK